MPKVNVNVPHSLGRDEAMRRMKEKRTVVEGFEAAGAKIVNETWLDYGYQMTAEMMGGKVLLEIDAEESEVTAKVELPLVLMLAQEIIRGRLESGLRELLV